MIEEFIKAGDLVFDIGANKGDYAKECVALGATVISVEPWNIHAESFDHPKITFINAAVSDQIGDIQLYTSTDHTFTSIYETWVQGHPGTGNGTITVPTITLDHMIDIYGIPDFIKIDTEGHEHKVLAALTHPVKALSFEYHGGKYPRLLNHDPLPECFNLLHGYMFRFAQHETQWVSEWVTADQALDLLPQLSWGDVYASGLGR
jgi:FkbM family methyltransferase